MMAAAYSLDLRRKVIAACERGSGSSAEVAAFFGVSKPFVDKLLRQYRQTGRLEPERKRPGRHALIDAIACEHVQQWLVEQPDLTLAELADRLKQQHDLPVSVSCVWRLMRRLGLRRKKRRSMQQNAIHRRYYWHANSIARSLQTASSST